MLKRVPGGGTMQPSGPRSLFRFPTQQQLPPPLLCKVAEFAPQAPTAPRPQGLGRSRHRDQDTHTHESLTSRSPATQRHNPLGPTRPAKARSFPLPTQLAQLTALKRDLSGCSSLLQKVSKTWQCLHPVTLRYWRANAGD